MNDPEDAHGLEMRCSETGGELTQFLQAANNRMRPHLPVSLHAKNQKRRQT